MVKEKLIITKQEASINLAGNNIDSMRFNDKLFQGYRVYENGKIGVVGAKGKADDDEMFAKAKNALSNAISYDVELSKNHQEKIYLTKHIFSEKEYLERVKKVVQRLTEKYPDFIFSGKFNYTKVSRQLKNTEKLDLYYEDEYLGFYFIIKDRLSSNIFDTAYGGNERYFDEEKVIYDVGLLLDKYHNLVDIEAGEYPVIIDFGYVNKKFVSDLQGEVVASGASLFSTKIGEKIFNDNFTVYLDKNPETAKGVPFFDAEGVVNKNYRYKIIDKGTIISPYSSKKVAKQYNLPITGSAVSSFDGVPTTECHIC